MADTERLSRLFAAIDAANGRDPDKLAVNGSSVSRATLYGVHMSDALARYKPDASENLRIAARAQHIERWTIPRHSYPDGRVGYLSWRKDLQKLHAQRTGELMRAEGYGEGDIDRVGALLRKERLKYDAEVQVLEDVICLVFLEFEAAEFIAKHDDDKVRSILAKTAMKMSPQGVEAAGRLKLDPRLGRLLAEALGEISKAV